MKIQFCSDLHLEFIENRKYLKANPIVPIGDILILAGDITLLRMKHDYQYFFKNLSKKFKEVYWIPGNHEYYHSDLENTGDNILENIYNNVFLVNNHKIVYDEVEIILSTLWSHIPIQHEWTVQKNVSDFEYIKKHGKTIMPKDFNQFHDHDLHFIKTEVEKPSNKKKVVVSHHVPTLLNYPKHFLNSEINGAFVTELFDFIESSNIDYWIYGHHHCNTPDFKIGNTTMVTNQLGYVRQNENLLYRNDKIIEI